MEDENVEAQSQADTSAQDDSHEDDGYPLAGENPSPYVPKSMGGGTPKTTESLNILGAGQPYVNKNK